MLAEEKPLLRVKDLKVEYTIVLKKINGVLKMILHDSHLPFQNK